MENATKALLIAAGMLLAVMLISLLVISYNRISSYYQQSSELLTIEQLDKFNKQFQNYSGKEDIRGNELISLMNKIIDYNVSQSYQEGTNYEPIKMTITIGNQYVDSFKYTDGTDFLGVKNDYITDVIQNTISGVNNEANDIALKAITNTPAEAIADAEDAHLTITDTQLQKLSAEISYILTDETATDSWAVDNRKIRASLLKSILKLTVGTGTGYDIQVDSNYKTTNVDGKEKIDVIKSITSRYYQYTQFKRACFRCTEVNHNSNTGRVVEMKFEVMIEDQKVKFD